MLKESEISNYESVEEALMIAIRSSNKEMKQIASLLWPTDPVHTAHQRLVDALNPSKRQKLSINEISYICNICNRYDPLHFFCDQCLHERPKRKSIETEEVEIREKIEDMYSKMIKAYQELKNITSRRDEIEKIRSGVISLTDFEKGFFENRKIKAG